uniref:hypothetical protein n=1 Tax=Mycobacterium celatum TaxID=28045 RepID=UPI000A6CA8B0
MPRAGRVSKGGAEVEGVVVVVAARVSVVGDVLVGAVVVAVDDGGVLISDGSGGAGTGAAGAGVG